MFSTEPVTEPQQPKKNIVNSVGKETTTLVKKMNYENSKQMAKSLLLSTYAQSLQSINIGFSLAAALAWNEVVRDWISRNLKDVKKSNYYHLAYASLVTALASIVFLITKTFLDRDVKKVTVSPVII